MNMEYIQMVKEIKFRSAQFYECRVKTEKCAEVVGIRNDIRQLSREMKVSLNVDMPELLMALMDAYEITRDEEMLQEVLDVVSRGIGELKASPENVQLLSYCYYYVEDDECAEKAKQMLHELAQNFSDGQNSPEFEKTLEIYHEFIGM